MKSSESSGDESASPRRRLGLAAKFNLLALSLVVTTSLGLSVFAVRHSSQNTYGALLTHGRSVAAMLALHSESAIYLEDKKALQQIAESLSADADVAYVAIVTPKGEVLVQNLRPSAERPTALVPVEALPAGTAVTREVDTMARGRYIDIIAPILAQGGGDPSTLFSTREPARAPRTVLGYVQLGLSQNRIRGEIAQFLLSTFVVTTALVALVRGCRKVDDAESYVSEADFTIQPYTGRIGASMAQDVDTTAHA